MRCRIRYDVMLAKRYKRLMLLCDRASLYGGSFYVARELMCEMASLWNGEFAAALIGDEKFLITDGFITSNTDNISDLVQRLGNTAEGHPFELSEYINDEMMKGKTEEEVIRLCHYTNLRLLTPEDNLEKSDKIEGEIDG